MSVLTLHLADEKHAGLRALARRRRTSINRLMIEMATVMIAEADAETRFLIRAERGRGQQARGLALLRKAAAKK